MRYLLDTNIVSDLVRNPQGKVAQHIRRLAKRKSCTSIIVAAELRYGATKKRLTAALGPARSGAWGVGSLALRGAGRCPPTDCCVRGLSRLADQSAPMTCSLPARRFPLGYTIVTDNDKEFASEDLRRENLAALS